jgi:AcrR family transcriptional regulator
MRRTRVRSAGDGKQRRTGRPPRLSREAVVAATAAVVAREGIQRLTIRRVADELHSSPMAIYRHVRDKDQLVVLLLDKLVNELEHPAMPSDPRERVLVAFQVIRNGLAHHPWVVDILTAGDLMAPAVLNLMEDILAGLVACGLSVEQAASAYRRLWRFTVGELVIRHATSERSRQLTRPPFQLTVLETAEARHLPTLASARQYWARPRVEDTYAEDLAALVDGLLATASTGAGAAARNID